MKSITIELTDDDYEKLRRLSSQMILLNNPEKYASDVITHWIRRH